MKNGSIIKTNFVLQTSTKFKLLSLHDQTKSSVEIQEKFCKFF